MRFLPNFDWNLLQIEFLDFFFTIPEILIFVYTTLFLMSVMNVYKRSLLEKYGTSFK